VLSFTVFAFSLYNSSGHNFLVFFFCVFFLGVRIATGGDDLNEAPVIRKEKKKFLLFPFFLFRTK
jgi:hypothetical protein